MTQYNRKIPVEEHPKILELRKGGMGIQEIGDLYGVTGPCIDHICRILHGVSGRDVWKSFHYRRFFWFVGAAARIAEAKAEIGDEHFPHGKIKGYRRGCHCDECRRALRIRAREWRLKDNPFPSTYRWKP